MFEFVCKEKQGDVRRTVRLVPRSVPRIFELISKLEGVPSFLPLENQFAPFIQTGNIFLEVDDVGLIALIPEETLVHCHITFWDKRLRGREELCRTVADWTLAFLNRPLLTGIPVESRAVLAFAKRVGFSEVARDSLRVALAYYPE